MRGSLKPSEKKDNANQTNPTQDYLDQPKQDYKRLFPLSANIPSK